MKKLVFTITTLLIVFIQTNAQSVKHYGTSAFELDFSSSIVKNGVTGQQYSPVLRFSGFYNMEHQFHFDFTDHFGIYTGLGIHNVGLITHPSDSIKIKQRAYGLTVPLGFKFGNMDKRHYITIGASIDYFFNYKEKFFVKGEGKIKDNQWFSDKKVNPFNPAAFIAYESRKGVFIIAKYYLTNFLKPQSGIQVNNTHYIQGYTESSQLFYVGIGLNIRSSSLNKRGTVSPPKKPTA